MRPRRRCCRGFCAALSIQHPLSLPLLSPNLISSLFYYLSVCFSLVFILRHSSSPPFYFVLPTFLALSFSFFFHFSPFISFSSLLLFLSAIYSSLSLLSSLLLSYVFLSLCLALSLSLCSSLSLSRFCYRVSDFANRHYIPATARSILRRLCFSKIPKVSSKYNQCH